MKRDQQYIAVALSREYAFAQQQSHFVSVWRGFPESPGAQHSSTATRCGLLYISLYLVISVYISPYLPTSPYISLYPHICLYLPIAFYILIRTEVPELRGHSSDYYSNYVRRCRGLRQMQLPPRKSDKSENDPRKHHYLSAGTIKNTR